MAVRKEIHDLTAAELDKFRAAFTQLIADSGTEGFLSLAGMYGQPKWYCPHGSTLFLPWHRAYILRLERALQAFDSDVFLPYWDWASATAQGEGLPAAYTDATYTPQGASAAIPNPLASVNVPLLSHATARTPGPRGQLASFAASVELCMAQTTYLGFNAAIEGPHNSLHGWTGGDMGLVSAAAYDPIFWVHHANVDRQWARWQASPKGVDPASDVASQDFSGRGLSGTVQSVLDWTALGYSYPGITRGKKTTAMLDSNGAFNFAGDDLAATRMTQSMAEGVLVIRDIQRGMRSFRVNVFANAPDATANTPIDNNPAFVGAFALFGMGDMGMPMAQMDMNMPPAEVQLDVSEALSTDNPVSFKLVATDTLGEAVSLSELGIGNASLQTIT